MLGLLPLQLLHCSEPCHPLALWAVDRPVTTDTVHSPSSTADVLGCLLEDFAAFGALFAKRIKQVLGK